MAKTVGKEAVKNRVKKFVDKRNEMIKDVANLHVKIQQGNRKTGVNCWTVSLLPVVDCVNCDKCMWDCYDLKSDLIYPAVINDRCRNSAIHKADPNRFWTEVNQQIKANYVTEFRINVGGDLTDDDFGYVAELGRNNRRTMILFFTKNYKGINKYLTNNEFPKNVKTLMSVWEGMEMDNPRHLPCSHVLWEDGTITAPQYGGYLCMGNCSECAFWSKGCWSLKQGEHVVFQAH